MGFKKNFAVSSSGRYLGASREYLLQLDFASCTVILHKVKRGKQIRREFELVQLVKVQRGDDDTELHLLFNTEQPYQKTLWFQNNPDRELFCKLVHAGIVTGPQAYQVFLHLDQDKLGMLTKARAAEGLTESVRSRANSELASPKADESGPAPGTVQLPALEDRVTFPDFLLMFAEREENKYDHSALGDRHENSVRVQTNPLFSASPDTISDSDSDENEEPSKLKRDTAGIASGAPPLRRQQTAEEMELDRATEDPSFLTELFPWLEPVDGERIMLGQPYTSLMEDETTQGTLFMSNYRLLFRDYNPGRKRDRSLEVPLGLLSRVEQVGGKVGSVVLLHVKDYRQLKFAFNASDIWVEKFCEQVSRMAFPGDQMKSFAYSHAMAVRAEQNGWNLYDAEEEYKRNGLAASPDFRIFRGNAGLELSPTYPDIFVVPSKTTDEALNEVLSFRSRARIPVVTWIHPKTKATLGRCSQPLAGLKGRRCKPDEDVFRFIREATPGSDSLYIIDARPYKAAFGNTLMGKGFENMDLYENCKLEFMEIDNIHAIRNSHHALAKLLLRARGQKAAVAGMKEDAPTHDTVRDSFLSAIEGSQWLFYVRILVEASAKMAHIMDQEGASVVVHCSDGWDRTSQLTSLTQILLDPYNRTMKGFACLLEKEWLSFGHKFGERHGNADGNYGNEQRAPIFLHFMDGVHQLLVQFPQAFEFNEDFLITIMDHVYTCRFGTFLYDNLKERREGFVRTRTTSIWTYTFAKENLCRYLNPLYNSSGTPTRLRPCTNPRRIVLWNRYFLRYRDGVDGLKDNRDTQMHLLLMNYKLLQQAVVAQGLNLADLDPVGASLQARPDNIFWSQNIDAADVERYSKQKQLQVRRRRQSVHPGWFEASAPFGDAQPPAVVEIVDADEPEPESAAAPAEQKSAPAVDNTLTVDSLPTRVRSVTPRPPSPKARAPTLPPGIKRAGSDADQPESAVSIQLDAKPQQ